MCIKPNGAGHAASSREFRPQESQFSLQRGGVRQALNRRRHLQSEEEGRRLMGNDCRSVCKGRAVSNDRISTMQLSSKLKNMGGNINHKYLELQRRTLNGKVTWCQRFWIPHVLKISRVHTPVEKLSEGNPLWVFWEKETRPLSVQWTRTFSQIHQFTSMPHQMLAFLQNVIPVKTFELFLVSDSTRFSHKWQ